MSDSLNDLMNTIMAHPAATELLSLIPAVGGAVLQARRGRVGGPLGAGLEVLGQYGLDKAQQGAKLQETTAHNQSLSKLLSGITPQTKLQDVLKKGAEVGLDPSDVIGGYQAVNPAAKPGLKRDPYTDWRAQNPKAPLSDFYKLKPPGKTGASPWKIENLPGVPPYEINLETGETRPVKGAPTRPMAAGININMQKPISPGDIQYAADGKTPVGVWMAGKDGKLTLSPVPAGLPAIAPPGGKGKGGSSA